MTDDFPSPPIPAEELRAKLDTFNTTVTAAVAAETAAPGAARAGGRGPGGPGGQHQGDLKYAEVAVRDQPEKLSKLGWGLRRDGTPLQPPGEVRNITITAARVVYERMSGPALKGGLGQELRP